MSLTIDILVLHPYILLFSVGWIPRRIKSLNIHFRCKKIPLLSTEYNAALISIKYCKLTNLMR